MKAIPMTAYMMRSVIRFLMRFLKKFKLCESKNHLALASADIKQTAPDRKNIPSIM